MLRADASPEIGVGHVMRSLALGEALVAAGWEVTLASAALPAEMAARAVGKHITVHEITSASGGEDDAMQTAGRDPHLVIVDGYHFEASFFAALDRQACPYAVIDDNGETRASAPVAVINHNPHATPDTYHYRDATLLLGLEYALLRPQILQIDRGSLSPSTSHPVFLTMGGSDPLGLTLPVAESLDALGIGARVALGPALDRRDEVEGRLVSMRSVRIVPPRSFADELARSELAVLAAGTTTWEAAYLGVPAVAVVVASNQAAPSHAAETLGFARRLDLRERPHSQRRAAATAVAAVADELLRDPAAREEMSLRGRAAVDGSGSTRVAGALDSLVPAPC